MRRRRGRNIQKGEGEERELMKKEENQNNTEEKRQEYK